MLRSHSQVWAGNETVGALNNYLRLGGRFSRPGRGTRRGRSGLDGAAARGLERDGV